MNEDIAKKLDELDARTNVYYLDRKGNKISSAQFFTLSQDLNYTVVAQDKLPDGRVLSTCWLPMAQFKDHPIYKTPWCIETMLRPDDITLGRFVNDTEALEGHQRILKELQDGGELK